jgi:tellurite resistance protein
MKPNFHYLHETFGAPRDGAGLPNDPTRFMRAGKAVLVVAGADGEVSPAELDYLLGLASAYGAPPEAMDEYRKFDYKKAKLEELITADDGKYGLTGEVIVYDAIRVSYADGHFAPAEHQAAVKLASLLGVNQQKFDAIVKLVEAENRMRNERIALLNSAPPGAVDPRRQKSVS